MTDYFALLGQTRLPWIDPDESKAAFLARSGQVHPDRFHNAPEEERCAANAAYVELNTAHQRLRESKDRLLHLLELELGRKPEEIQNVPAEALEMFMKVGKLCRDVDAFRAERARASSPILQAQLYERALDWTDQLQSMQQSIASQRLVLETRLKTMNALWESAPVPGEPARSGSLPLTELEQLYRQFGFLARWSGQLQDRLVSLAL
jgi:curved DNA-binding protein CbpA